LFSSPFDYLFSTSGGLDGLGGIGVLGGLDGLGGIGVLGGRGGLGGIGVLGGRGGLGGVSCISMSSSLFILFLCLQDYFLLFLLTSKSKRAPTTALTSGFSALYTVHLTKPIY